MSSLPRALCQHPLRRTLVLATLAGATYLTSAATAFADVEIDADVSVGFLAADMDQQAWGPWIAILAASAMFDYTSEIVCDGAAQPGNPLALGRSNKFAGPPLDGQRLPLWRKSFTGSLGSVGQTVALGSSRVQAGRYFAGFSAKAKAVAAGATGAARALSVIDDPWQFDVQETGDPAQHTMVAVTVTLDGLIAPPAAQSGGGVSRVSVEGDIGTIALAIDSRQGSFASDVQIAPDWTVYINAPLQRIATRVPQPSASTADQLKELLAAGFDPKTASWKSSRGAVQLTFVKDLGSTAADADFAIRVIAQDEAAGAGAASSSGAHTE